MAENGLERNCDRRSGDDDSYAGGPKPRHAGGLGSARTRRRALRCGCARNPLVPSPCHRRRLTRKFVNFVAKQPHVKMAVGVVIVP